MNDKEIKKAGLANRLGLFAKASDLFMHVCSLVHPAETKEEYDAMVKGFMKFTEPIRNALEAEAKELNRPAIDPRFLKNKPG